MSWITAIENWRKLPRTEQQRRRLVNLPYKVARNMVFKGKPVDQQMLEDELERLTQSQGQDT